MGRNTMRQGVNNAMQQRLFTEYLNKQNMNYSFYLFSKLFDVIIRHEYEYDLMFRDITNLYKTYEMSTYIDEDLPEYDCMTNFLTNNLDYINKQTTK